ncbi:MAG: hypothetical protein IJ071_05170 [Ruminococcus sp.]|nr:hypothetical protein [Ruminococcus sp.]
MSFFVFNGWNSQPDLIIQRPLARPSWAPDVTEITRPGAPRKIMQVSKSYSNADMTIDAVIAEATPETVRRIYQALNGNGQLVLSSAPDEILYAFIRPLVPEAVALTMSVLALTATLQPFAYAAEPTVATIGTAYTEIIDHGTVWSAPEIRFTPSAAGEVWIDCNGAKFYVTIPEELVGKEIIVDSEVEVTYYEENGVKTSVNQYTHNGYPLLHTGSNWICYSGSITGNMIVNVRERWL